MRRRTSRLYVVSDKDMKRIMEAGGFYGDIPHQLRLHYIRYDKSCEESFRKRFKLTMFNNPMRTI
jgi:hypothetical protein